MRSFFIALVLTLVAFVILTLGLRYLMVISTLPSMYWQTILFVTISTGVLFSFVYRASPEMFVQIYLLTLVLKLLASGVFVFLIIYIDRPNAIPNAVAFLLAYLIFTSLEIVFLYRKTRF